MDVTQLILDDHHEQPRLFAMIDQIDRSDITSLGSIWRHLGKFLDTHAEAEERFFYPKLLQIARVQVAGSTSVTRRRTRSRTMTRSGTPVGPWTIIRSEATHGSPPSTPATRPKASTWLRRSARA